MCCLAIVVGCLSLGLPRYRVNIDIADEGFLAFGAVRVLEGQIPNRDFVSLQPPLSFYTLAGVFKALGASLASLRIFGLCLYILIALVVYALGRQMANSMVALAGALPATFLGMPYFNFVPFAVWQGSLSSLASAFCTIRAAKTGHRGWALGSGLFACSAVLARQDQGFYVALSIVIYLLVLRLMRPCNVRLHLRQLSISWAIGLTAPLAVLGAYWMAIGAIPSMYQQLIVFPLTTYARTSSLPMPALGWDAPVQELAVIMLYYAPPLVYAMVGVWLFAVFALRRCRIEHAHFGFLLVLATLFYFQVLTRSDLHHLLITLAPFFVLCGWAAAAAASSVACSLGGPDHSIRWGRTAARGGLATAAILLMVFFLLVKTLILSAPELSPTMLTQERGGVRLATQTARVLDEVVGIIQSHTEPNRSILCLPSTPMLYFLANRRNPTKWNYLRPGDQSEEDHHALVQQARNDPPGVVVIIDEDEMSEYGKAIVEYVKREFQLRYEMGKMRIYLPVDST